MAQLSSPGVAVTVIDESFYTPAAPGTTPLIIVASAQDKQNGAGTGIAPGTTKENAGKVYLLTSQKDLSDTFGTPRFVTDSNNTPVHGSELNEYGLQAAYSYLGVSNRAYVVRADVDLGQLEASASAPTGEPVNGTFWIDTASTKFGIFQWNGEPVPVKGAQTFTNKIPLVITDTKKLLDGGQPRPSVGSIGDYAVVATTTTFRYWYKANAIGDIRPAIWVEVGSPEWTSSWPTVSSSSVDIGSIVDETQFNINGNLITIIAAEVGTPTIQDIVDAINLNTPEGTFAYTRSNKIFIYSDFDNVQIDGEGIASENLVNFEALGIEQGIGYPPPALQISKHTQVPEWKLSGNSPRTSGSVWIKTTEYNQGSKWIVRRYNSATSSWVTQPAPVYANGAQALYGLDIGGGGSKLAVNTLYIKSNDGETDPPIANFKTYRRRATGATIITSSAITDTTFDIDVEYIITIAESRAGQDALADPLTISFVGADPENLPDGALSKAQADAEALASAISNAQDEEANNFQNIVAEATAQNKVIIKHLLGGDFAILDEDRTVILQFIDDVNFYEAPPFIQDDVEHPTHFLASLWQPLTGAVNSDAAPTTEPEDGTLWYNSIHDEVDILIHNGEAWVGYQYNGETGISTVPSPYFGISDLNGPITSATEPTKQSDGVTDLADGDIWIDPSDPEFYPIIYKYNNVTLKWDRLDNTSQYSENGIIFADVRWGVDGGSPTAETKSTIKELLSSDYVDPDAPDPALYPKGMMLWNMRRSGWNVKRYVKNSIDTSFGAVNVRQNDVSTEGYFPARWESATGLNEAGVGRFGRPAQREVVIQALAALVNTNQEIRDEESRVFNLLATPGYIELIDEMVNLNYDRGLTAFVVADTPARLTPDATSLSNWGNNVYSTLHDDDFGLVTSDEYLGVFYPWGYTSDNLGNNIVVPPSHMMLRTIALSDNVSYPWFAPAGTRRGGITNASAVGYIDYKTGKFQSVALNTGQRDTLASIKVNPLTFITGTGLVNYGQYTRARNASSLDRINVARLVVYLRRQLNVLAKPYIFEPNDKITRDEIKQAAESLMLELVGQRAIYDFLVVCDTSNNTPSRIDRSELYLDIAIEPVKAVEFIYIPLRLKNTGEIKGLGGK